MAAPRPIQTKGDWLNYEKHSNYDDFSLLTNRMNQPSSPKSTHTKKTNNSFLLRLKKNTLPFQLCLNNNNGTEIFSVCNIELPQPKRQFMQKIDICMYK